jgi:hypothetical protein
MSFGQKPFGQQMSGGHCYRAAFDQQFMGLKVSFETVCINQVSVGKMVFDQ